jgi:hypothetical protein
MQVVPQFVSRTQLCHIDPSNLVYVQRDCVRLESISTDPITPICSRLIISRSKQYVKISVLISCASTLQVNIYTDTSVTKDTRHIQGKIAIMGRNCEQKISARLLFETSPSAAIGSVFVTIILSCLYMTWRSKLATPKNKHSAERHPPTEPYTVPLLGTLPFSYILRPYNFVLDPKCVAGFAVLEHS